MNWARSIKLHGLRVAAGLGVTGRLLESRWRQERLLILCYHGVSLEDEHEWGPALYLAPGVFRERMEALRRTGCTVLPLGEGLRRLYARTLPARAVAITFDDGGYDFYRVAYPMLRAYGYPATLYLTTYYAVNNRPVFDVMLSYLLWKGREGGNWLADWLGEAVRLDEGGRAAACRRIRDDARRAGLSAGEKDELLAELASGLRVDYGGLCARRMLHLMNLEEAREVAAGGVDVQLHTHRHRVSRQRELFVQEIAENRRWVEGVRQGAAEHFCYPGGYHLPEFAGFLRGVGVESATTCEPGLAHWRSNRYYLPRLLDGSSLTGVEFTAWLSGLGALLPRRRIAANESQLLEYMPPER